VRKGASGIAKGNRKLTTKASAGENNKLDDERSVRGGGGAPNNTWKNGDFIKKKMTRDVWIT